MRLVLASVLYILYIAVQPVSCTHKAPRYMINLDAPPEERWKHVLARYDIDHYRELVKEIVETYIPKLLVPALNLLVSPLEEFIPEPYAGEIRGIAKTTGIGLGEIVALNIVYDVTAFCTSIVAQDTEGTIWHGRNLDYTLTSELKNLTIVVDYHRRHRVQYTTTSFLGQVGVFTGMKPHRFTASLNERNQGSVEKNIEALIEALLFKRGSLTTFELRNVLHNSRDFEEAVEQFSTNKLVAPVYVIVGGINPGEGVVITRDQEHADIWHLDAKSDRWFLLETNYDHWKPPPAHDDRRTPGNEAMKKVGQRNINDQTMYEVLSVKPVLNVLTAYTCLMTAAHPELYDTIVRD